jgi:phage-related tail fiber protein
MSSYTITWPSDTKQVIDAIRGVIGRDITITAPNTASGCSTCSLDPVNNTSTDPFCPTCSGNYWIITYAETTVSGHVRWYPFDEPHAMTGGIVFEGDCIVTIEYTSDNLEAAKAADWFTVDGKRMVLWKYLLRGKQPINRIRLMLKEEEQ